MELVTTKLCKTSDIGFHGNLFGGKMMAWLDEAGAAFAGQVAESTMMVTKCISDVEFIRPVKAGRIVKIYGEILKVGNSSVVIKLEARNHNHQSGRQKKVCETTMVFVRIDEDGEPVPLNKGIKEKL